MNTEKKAVNAVITAEYDRTLASQLKKAENT